MAKKGIDPKCLEGLSFNFSEKEEVEKDGRKTVQYIPRKRPLTEEDLLDFKDYGDRVVFVTKNGNKHTIKKAAGAAGQAK